jgi:hypothetical protein
MSLPGVSRQRRIRSVCWRTTVKASSSSRAWSSTSGGDAILKQGGLVLCEGRRNCFYSARMTMVWTAMAWPIDQHLRVAASRRSALHYQPARAPTCGPSSTAVSSASSHLGHFHDSHLHSPYNSCHFLHSTMALRHAKSQLCSCHYYVLLFYTIICLSSPHDCPQPLAFNLHHSYHINPPSRC